MPLTYPLLRKGSIVIVGTTLEVRIWLPWMRSLPWACVSDVAVFVDDRRTDPAQVNVETEAGLVRLEELAGLAGYWMVGRSVLLRVDDPSAVACSALVRVEVTCAIPYVFDANGPLIVVSEASGRPEEVGLVRR